MRFRSFLTELLNDSAKPFVLQSKGKRLILPDAQDVNKMLNFETDDETDADSIFSRQTSRDDCLDFDDEDDEEGNGFDGVVRNEGVGNKGVARGRC